MKCVRVQIDRLVLKGFRYEDRRAVAAGLQRELSRMLADAAVVRRLAVIGDVSSMRLQTEPMRSDAPPHQVGASAARAIRRSVSIGRAEPKPGDSHE
jgi:hypothetical protein